MLVLLLGLARPVQAQEYGAGGSIQAGVEGVPLRTCRPATVTAYSVEQFPGTTASGVRTPGRAGQIVAHGRNGAEGLPFGTAVWIAGLGILSVEDRGSGLSAGHFDVLLATTAEALRWGVQVRDVCEVGP